MSGIVLGKRFPTRSKTGAGVRLSSQIRIHCNSPGAATAIRRSEGGPASKIACARRPNVDCMETEAPTRDVSRNCSEQRLPGARKRLRPPHGRL